MKQVAIVTGVSGGIGYAVAEILLENGIAVVGMSRNLSNPPAGEFTYVKGDVSVREDRERLVELMEEIPYDVKTYESPKAKKAEDDTLKEMAEEMNELLIRLKADTIELGYQMKYTGKFNWKVELEYEIPVDFR